MTFGERRHGRRRRRTGWRENPGAELLEPRRRGIAGEGVEEPLSGGARAVAAAAVRPLLVGRAPTARAAVALAARGRARPRPRVVRGSPGRLAQRPPYVPDRRIACSHHTGTEGERERQRGERQTEARHHGARAALERMMKADQRFEGKALAIWRAAEAIATRIASSKPWRWVVTNQRPGSDSPNSTHVASSSSLSER